jgi:hypothetical protein
MNLQPTRTFLFLVIYLSLPHEAIAKPPPSLNPNRPTQRHVPSLYETPFAKSVLSMGRTFRKILPKTWNLEWSPSTLRQIHWQAGPQSGFRMRFVHRKQKVAVPIPFPQFGKGHRNTQLIPLRCSLHFYPREGLYEAHSSRISRLAPARLLGVTRAALVFLPDRFSAKEFPCPSVIRSFRKRFLRTTKRRLNRRKRRYVRRYATSIRWGRYHVWLKAKRALKKWPWYRLRNTLRRNTIIIRHKDPLQTTLKIWNRQAIGGKPLRAR